MPCLYNHLFVCFVTNNLIGYENLWKLRICSLGIDFADFGADTIFEFNPSAYFMCFLGKIKYLVGLHPTKHGLRIFFFKYPIHYGQLADILGYFGTTICCKNLEENLLCIPSWWFCITKPFFLQKVFTHTTVVIE